jgi:hypothetical protein|tara:strand:+ start:659 stop:820 length:162 start_codon:yes stop_codon:yes gene_type:complete
MGGEVIADALVSGVIEPVSITSDIEEQAINNVIRDINRIFSAFFMYVFIYLIL